MHRTWLRHLVLLTAFLHLFADVALAGGAVLCVGPNDHEVIEFGHIAPDCEALANTATRGSDTPLGPGSCSGCEDRPLHDEAELASGHEPGDYDAPPALAVRIIPAPTSLARGVVLPRLNRLVASGILRAQRSTVLLI